MIWSSYSYGYCILYRYFVQGAVDIYECSIVNIQDSIFMHNGPVSHTLKTQPFRGNSGGLSISYNNIENPNIKLVVVVERCTFINNSALPSPELQQTSSSAISTSIFSGRGGALGLLLNNQLQHVEVMVRDCSFHGNSAKTFGGGVYVVFGYGSSHTTTISQCTFENNTSPFSTGGLFAAFLGQGSPSKHSVHIVTDCTFFHNRALQGGGAVGVLSGNLGKYLDIHVVSPTFIHILHARLFTYYMHANYARRNMVMVCI